MKNNNEIVENLYDDLNSSVRESVDSAIDSITDVLKNRGKVAVVTGSGPNLHEGVTTLIAEMINKDILHGVTTSSAVIAHEMGGVLDEVKRVNGLKMGLNPKILPRGDIFEITVMSEESLELLKKEMIIDALKKTRGNQTRAAGLLDTSLRIINYKIHKLGIDSRLYRLNS